QSSGSPGGVNNPYPVNQAGPIFNTGTMPTGQHPQYMWGNGQQTYQSGAIPGTSEPVSQSGAIFGGQQGQPTNGSTYPTAAQDTLHALKSPTDVIARTYLGADKDTQT